MKSDAQIDKIRTALRFDYDAFTDILTIEGVKYSGELFRALGVDGLATDCWFRIVSREDGILSIAREEAHAKSRTD